MKKPAKKKPRGAPRFLNALVCCLVTLAVCLGGIAAWRRYMRPGRPDEAASEARDAVRSQIDAFVPDVAFADGLTWAGGPRQNVFPDPGIPFACPQCRSRCWSPPGSSPPACPFCGSAMVSRRPALTPAGGTPVGSGAPAVVIGAGAIRPHGDRGICTNCHTMAISDQGLSISFVGGAPAGGAASPISIRAGAARPHVDRGACTNCHTIVRPAASQPVLTPVGAASPGCATMQMAAAAPAIEGPAPPAAAPDAGAATLVKELGIEVRPAPGSGARVSGVMGNSYAANAGLRTGDIIIECNGTRVRGVEQFQRLVSLATPEADAQIRIIRDGRALDLLIMVGEGEMEGFSPIRRL